MAKETTRLKIYKGKNIEQEEKKKSF